MTTEQEIQLKLRIQSAERVCYRCGVLYGKGNQKIVSTWMDGEICEICHEVKSTTNFRDFGYAKAEYYTGNISE